MHHQHYGHLLGGNLTGSLTTSIFTLVTDGTTTPISATVALSSDGKKATLTPKTNLNSRTTYGATVKGGTSGVKDVKENALASNKSRTFKTAR